MSANRPNPASSSVNQSQGQRTLIDYKKRAVFDETTPWLAPRDHSQLLKTTLFTYFPHHDEKLRDLRWRSLWQAAMDDKQAIVKKILDKDPSLLLLPAPEGFIIQSQYKRPYKKKQRFDVSGETALSFVAKHKQLEMIKVMAPYYQALANESDTNQIAVAEALSKWAHYTFDANNNIVIPQKYLDFVDGIITLLTQENLARTHEVTDPLSDAGEKALTTFRDIVLPDAPVKLGNNLEDGYWDIELLVFTMIKRYADRFDANNAQRYAPGLIGFQSEKQRDVYLVKIVGFAQSVFTPEMAKRWCYGIWNNLGEAPCETAENLALRNKQSFYPEDRDIFFMKKGVKMRVSGKTHLYLYKDEAGKISYALPDQKVLNKSAIHYLNLDAASEIKMALQNEVFNQPEKDPARCEKEELRVGLLKETNKLGHTLSVSSATLGIDSFCDIDGGGCVLPIGEPSGRLKHCITIAEQKQRIYGELCSQLQRSQDAPTTIVINRRDA